MKKTILEYSITIGICLILAFLICVISGLFTYEEPFRIYGILCDGFFISGIFAFSVGILVFVHNHGVFDMLIYGLQRFFALLRRNQTNISMKRSTIIASLKRKDQNQIMVSY